MDPLSKKGHWDCWTAFVLVQSLMCTSCLSEAKVEQVASVSSLL